MSLEQTIAANTEAVAAQTTTMNAFIALLQNSAATVQAVKTNEGTTSSDVLAKSKMNDESAKTETETAKKSTKTKAAKPEPKVEEVNEGELTLGDVTPVVVELAKKDRAAAIALLGEFGAKKATELKAEDYDAFLKKANAIISGEAQEDDDLV